MMIFYFIYFILFYFKKYKIFKLMEHITIFLKKDVFSIIFIQSGISILKSFYYSVLYTLNYLKDELGYKKRFLLFYKIAIYRDVIQTNIMGIMSLVGAFVSQFNCEKK